jgi:hypothetical protein
MLKNPWYLPMNNTLIYQGGGSEGNCISLAAFPPLDLGLFIGNT